MEDNWCLMIYQTGNFVEIGAIWKVSMGVDLPSSGAKLSLWSKAYGQHILSVNYVITSKQNCLTTRVPLSDGWPDGPTARREGFSPSRVVMEQVFVFLHRAW